MLCHQPWPSTANVLQLEVSYCIVTARLQSMGIEEHHQVHFRLVQYTTQHHARLNNKTGSRCYKRRMWAISYSTLSKLHRPRWSVRYNGHRRYVRAATSGSGISDKHRQDHEVTKPAA